MVVFLLLVIIAILLMGSSAFIGAAGIILGGGMILGAYFYGVSQLGISWIWGFYGFLGLIAGLGYWGNADNRKKAREEKLRQRHEKLDFDRMVRENQRTLNEIKSPKKGFMDV